MPTLDIQATSKKLLGESLDSLQAQVIVRRLIEHFLTIPLSEDGERKLVDFFEGADRETRLLELIQFILSSPQYQLS